MPNDVLDRIREACFGRAAATRASSSHDTLAPFQDDAVHRLRGMMDRRGGAILADSVGLGKTHIAVALVRDAIDSGCAVLVTGPAQLKTHWTRHLRGVPRWRWLSHTSMSRGRNVKAAASLVVVDEAHAFRNPAANRYATLALACEHARVLLITATPVNNSILDFYHLVRLFAADDAFTDIGVPDIGGAFAAALRGRDAADVRRVAADVMVRRTRHAVALWGTAPNDGPQLVFPKSGNVEMVRYDHGAASTDVLRTVHEIIPALSFPAHGHGAARGAAELMRLGLLKRFESSAWAMRASVHRHMQLLEYFVRAARAGMLFDARTGAAHIHGADGAIQLSLDPLVLPRWPTALDRDALVCAALRDMDAFRTILACLTPEHDHGADPKAVRLAALLDEEVGGEAVLLFTEYRETARGLWRSLARRDGVALIHGSDARLGRNRSSRRAIIERFAPLSNGARPPRNAERVSLLIATDVLAEGLNLQDARIVISYDLPWNPVRLAQRIGRIDRLGSPHECIRTFAFMPDRDVDTMLHMMKRIRRKLKHIRMVGGDAPAFAEPAAARRPRGRKPDVMVVAAAEAREAARAAYLAHLTPDRATGRSTCMCAVATVQWPPSWVSPRYCGDAPHGAALCCFRLNDGPAVLVLVEKDRPCEIDSARAWSILAAITDARCTDGMSDRARSAERHARRALRRLYDSRTSTQRNGTATQHAAGRAGAAVLRWLAHRPGGPSDDEARQADLVLSRLSAGHRVGAHVRIDRALRSAGAQADIVGTLARVLEEDHNDRDATTLRGTTAVRYRLRIVGTILIEQERVVA